MYILFLKKVILDFVFTADATTSVPRDSTSVVHSTGYHNTDATIIRATISATGQLNDQTSITQTQSLSEARTLSADISSAPLLSTTMAVQQTSDQTKKTKNKIKPIATTDMQTAQSTLTPTFTSSSSQDPGGTVSSSLEDSSLKWTGTTKPTCELLFTIFHQMLYQRYCRTIYLHFTLLWCDSAQD